MDEILQAAAFHGLATNVTVPEKERLACALQALDIYEAAHDKSVNEHELFVKYMASHAAHRGFYGVPGKDDPGDFAPTELAALQAIRVEARKLNGEDDD